MANKLRIQFKIEDRENAMSCFEAYSYNSRLTPEGDKGVIYYVKPEDIFEKYGDIEAEKYEKEQ